MRHDDSLLSFDVPRDWLDKSEVRYEMPVRPGEEGSSGRAVLVRDLLADSEDLGAFVERRMRSVAEVAEGFVLRGVTSTPVGVRPAIETCHATVEAGVPWEHRGLHVQVAERRVAILTLSAARTELAHLEPLFERMLASASAG